MEVRINEPMKRHTSFRAGGNAAWFAIPETAEELKAVIHACKRADAPWYVLGNGSNLLVSDSGFPGVIISMEKLRDLPLIKGLKLLTRLNKTELLNFPLFNFRNVLNGIFFPLQKKSKMIGRIVCVAQR